MRGGVGGGQEEEKELGRMRGEGGGSGGGQEDEELGG